ncbi:hypothetical protein [Streptomyces sp. NPDC056244]|uniref:hypothetical protein n=1 Tax=Streptomyces sp. NPDC056244 TaxID=3345762 RepID=UPI0035DEFD58
MVDGEAAAVFAGVSGAGLFGVEFLMAINTPGGLAGEVPVSGEEADVAAALTDICVVVIRKRAHGVQEVVPSCRGDERGPGL